MSEDTNAEFNVLYFNVKIPPKQIKTTRWRENTTGVWTRQGRAGHGGNRQGTQTTHKGNIWQWYDTGLRTQVEQIKKQTRRVTRKYGWRKQINNGLTRKWGNMCAHSKNITWSMNDWNPGTEPKTQLTGKLGSELHAPNLQHADYRAHGLSPPRPVCEYRVSGICHKTRPKWQNPDKVTVKT